MKKLSFNKGRPDCLCILIFSMLISNQICAGGLTFPSYTKQLQQQITGTVTDVSGPLLGVTVAIKGTAVVAVTDEKGHFTITASPTDVLVFSFIGYATREITVGNQTSINVVLSEDSTQLQEVIVNVGYYSVKDSERTGNIARITSKDIEKQPVTNVLATMQGRMAGVSIVQSTGVGGGGFAVEIRGTNSLRNDANAPLYIIDGVPYSSDSMGYSASSSVMPMLSSPLSNINPGDIASLEVLKDADATAIYGSRGANGVILVTTKRGKAGKTAFTGKISSGFGSVTRFMDLMNTAQYLKVRAEAFANDGYAEYPADAYDINGTWDQTRSTDWQEALTGGTAEITNINVSLSVGSENTQFLLSGNFGKETTVFPGDFAYKKGNIHLNLNHQSSSRKFQLVLSAGYTLQDNNQPGTDLTTLSRQLSPNAPALYDSEGNLNWENSTWENPLASLNGKSLSNTNDFIANGVLSYNFPQNIVLKSNFGFTSLRHRESNSFPSTIFDPAYQLGSQYSSIVQTTADRKSWIIEPQLNWSREVGNGKVEILVGGTFQQQIGSQLSQSAEGFASNSLLYNLASASQHYVLNSGETVYKYNAMFGRVNLNWKQRYILNITGRRDGSSRFGPGKQFANFGAIGAAWLFSKEELFSTGSSPILSFGKLRASYGATGNDQIGDYQFLDTYSSGGTYNGNVGLQPSRLFNPDFGWEINKKFELAAELGFLNDRLFLTASFYSNRSSNQLIGIPLLGTTGFNTIQANFDATVQNRGLELTLRTVNFKTEKFGWTTTINFTKAKNKLISFPGLQGSTYRNRFVVGQPINIVKVYHMTGVDPQTGNYGFEDFNGDGIISATADKQLLRDLSPEYYGGIQNEFNYKGLQLDFLFQFVKQLNYNATTSLGMPGSSGNQTTDIINHWQNSGDMSNHQGYSTGSDSEASSAYSRYRESDAAITDASYIRLKNISLTYQLPSKWTKSVQCRISIEGQNMWTITSFKGADPEFRSIGYLPPLKIFTTGLQITF